VLELQAELGFAPFRVLQNCNNLALRDVDEPVRQLCTAHRIAIVTYSPLGAGFLTSKHRHGVPHGSRFDLIPSHQRIYFQKTAYDRLTRLETVARRTGYSQVQLALAWALHQRGVASVLVGGRTPMHLDQAFAALAIHEPSIFAELEAD
jgi:aryl-alcohol dehydrogenase-like predicted oxidoreductase